MADETAKGVLSGKKRFIILIIGVFLAGWFAKAVFSPSHNPGVAEQAKQAKVIWTCPMHPQIILDKPGECPICHMTLVKREEAKAPSAENQAVDTSPRKILHYRNPMNPSVTSPVPMKDEMGMDYVPVYEERTTVAHEGGVYISSRRQQLIGVKKETVQERDLTMRIDTVGKVAYLPNLYMAQQEYLQTIRYQRITQNSASDKSLQDSRQNLIEVTKSKLLAQGMSESQIRQIEQTGKPEVSLYLPENEQVWVSITIYEQDAEYVKEGLPVEVEAIAYPGKTLKGKIASIAPILEAMTRTLQVRALVDNPGNLLRMEMTVNVRIQIPLGKKTAVSQDAVMHTGTKDMVYVVRDEDYFVGREVELGAKAQGYYEVRKGLQAGDVVVTSGNFLIDSESKLNAALSRIADSNEKP
jgi:multidrug efflux pump subunit AcrA (membrane-fusion protein)